MNSRPASHAAVRIPRAQWENFDRDEKELAVFGKKQQLKRRFRTIAIIGLTSTLMVTWEGALLVLGDSLHSGGPLGYICAFLFAWIGVTSQALVMAELASMIPVAGGQYNWVAVLAPPAYSKFLSYLVGWITTIGWHFNAAASLYLTGTLIQGLVVLQHPEYAPTRWQTTLIFYALIALAVFINTVLGQFLPEVESIVLLLHLFGFIATLIPLACLGPKASAKDVFQTFKDSGGWHSDGLTFLVGTSLSMLIFIGVDGAAHLAEEIEDASRTIPLAMLCSVTLSGLTGFGIILAALFSITNLDAVLDTTSGTPFATIFEQALGSPGSAVGLAIPLLLVQVFSTIGAIATASRMLWAFARERGIPGHRLICKVHDSTRLPLVAISVTATINILLALINLGSSAAFNAFTSITISAFYIVFMISASVALQRKLAGKAMQYGPFKLGRAAIPLTVFSLCYSLIGTLFSFWPQVASPSLEEMNWACVVFAGVLAFCLLYWVLYARRTYTGPVTEITLDQ